MVFPEGLFMTDKSGHFELKNKFVIAEIARLSGRFVLNRKKD